MVVREGLTGQGKGSQGLQEVRMSHDIVLRSRGPNRVASKAFSFGAMNTSLVANGK